MPSDRRTRKRLATRQGILNGGSIGLDPPSKYLQGRLERVAELRQLIVHPRGHRRERRALHQTISFEAA